MTSGKIAVMFPGQGSQYIGMGSEFVAADKDAEHLMAMAESVCNISLRNLCFDGPMEDLTQAANLQPALTVVNMICWQAVKKIGLNPDFFVGHSLGEYSALEASGALSPEDTIKLVAARGRIMGQAGKNNPGGMVAILGLSINEVNGILEQMACPDLVSVGNHNSEQQVVISGDSNTLKKVSDIAVEQGGKAIPLNVSIANHSPLMKPAVVDFEKELQAVNLKTPTADVLFNVTGKLEKDPEVIRQIMANQVISMVRWYDIVNELVGHGVQLFVEVGPKKVLSGLMKRILPRGAGHKVCQVDNLASLDKLRELL